MSEKDKRRRRGVKAIIELQRMADIEETTESAGKAWDGLSEDERDQTLAAYALFCNRGEESQEHEGHRVH